MTEKINKGPAFGQRHVQSLLIFFAIVVNYMGKFNASVAVVAMTNADTSNHDIPTYDWNEMERSYILSSFFWGYILTQFLGGWLCRRFGARITMFASTFGSAVMVILVPFFVPWGGWQSFCAIRGCMGAFQGMLFPSIHTHLANWCPPKERNRLGALSNTGIDFGSVVTMFVSGLIAASSIGWPGIFYVACGVEVLWCIFWLIFGANTPRQSKFISPEELEYIETTKNENKKLEEAKEMRQIPVPWKGILTSVPLWTLFLVRCTQAWGNSTLQAEIPAYMKGVLQMDMKSNALYSALPYLCSWILAFVYVIMADILLTRGILTITGIRKLINSLSSWLPAIFLIGLGFLDSDQKTWAIVLMCLSVGINAGSTIGCTLNTIDLSPNHAGILMGIVNTGGNGIPILTPLVVGVIVKNENDRAEWQVVFIISAVIFFVGNLFYVIFGQMVSQPWDAADFLDKQKASHIEENGEANLKAIEAKENAQQAEEKNISDQQEIKT